jgi:light-regulated signal transduction histidine kinase (bacteriophytochrome)
VHQSYGMLVIEWEAAEFADTHAAQPLATVEAMLRGIGGAATVPQFCQTVADALHAVIGCDRIMVYHFPPDDAAGSSPKPRRDNGLVS